MKNIKLLLLSCFCINAYSLHEQASASYYDQSPLAPCGISLEVHGGVYPLIWTDRDEKNDCCVLNSTHLPSFHKLFKVPFIIGGKIAYNWNECIEIFFEADYARSKGKCFTFDVGVCPGATPIGATLNGRISSYKLFALYLGTRYYLDFDCLWNDRVSFFIQTKIGAIFHKSINACFTATPASGMPSAPINVPLFFRTRTVSAGGGLGVDVDLCNCVSFIATIDFIGSGAIKNNPIVCLGSSLPGINATAIAVGRFTSEFSFPIMIGLKYSF